MVGRRVGGAALAGALLAVMAACVSSEVTPTGPAAPSRVDDCTVEVFVATRPTYPAIDIAAARVECHKLGGRHKCMTELRREACRAGADTIYGVVETAGHEHTYVTATLALKDRSIRVSRTPAAAVTAPEPPAAVAPPERACDPICSPGFACVAGQCAPQCNPPCEAGEACSRRRVCEPAGVGAPPVGGTASRGAGAPPPPANPALAPSWPPPPSTPPGPPILPPRGRPPRTPASPAYPGE